MEEPITEEIILEGPKRPQFITVLCILTYIGSGLGVVGSIFNWWWMKKMSGMINGTAEGMPEMDMDKIPDPEKLMAMIKYADIITISGILSSLICLAGALQMWKLKKTGFYIYTVGEIAPVIVSVACMGISAITGWGAFAVIIPATFLILYGMNLKHMD